MTVVNRAVCLRSPFQVDTAAELRYVEAADTQGLFDESFNQS